MVNVRIIKPLTLLLVIATVLSSCHTRKAAMKVEPGDSADADMSIAAKYAAIMGVSKANINNSRLYTFIDDWLGTPYLFGHMDKSGTDCSGFVYQLQQQVYGITLPRMTSQQVNVIKRKYEEQLQEGDMVFWDYNGKKFSHVGVYLQNDYVVHASTTKGVVIIKLHDPYTYKYFSRCGSVMASVQ